MKLLKYLFLSAALLGLASCSDNDEPGGGDKPHSGKYALSGKVEKGPFVRGSSISVQPLNESMSAIGTVFNGEIADDAGSFDLGQVELASQFVRISSDGYYFNEVKGELSQGTLHLIALADLSDKSTVNVNILTHLKAARIQKLMQGGKSFKDANAQAQKELLEQFGLQRYTSATENWTIASGSDEAAALIAISSLVLYNRTEAEITQYLSTLSQELAADGAFSENSKYHIAKDQLDLLNNLDNIADNVVYRYRELGKSVSVKDLKYYFDWNYDGIAGNEFVDNPQITLSQSELNFPKEGGEANITITANFPVSLETYGIPYKSSDLDITPGNSTIEDSFFDGFYSEVGKPIDCTYSLSGNTLNVKVKKTERRADQKASIYLYDPMNVAVATIEVNLKGDPNVESKLGSQGIAIVQSAYATTFGALSDVYLNELGYTGLKPEFYEVKCPLQPYNERNTRAFNSCYSAIARLNYILVALNNAGYGEASPFFQLLRTIVYTDMVEKWGNIGITEVSPDEMQTNIEQTNRENALRYVESKLNELENSFPDKKFATTSGDNLLALSKDIWRIAKANVYMGLNQPSQAIPYLQQVVDNNYYTLSSGDENILNDGAILFYKNPEGSVWKPDMSYYSLADVMLTLAECYNATGETSKATTLINKVAKAKDITVPGSAIADIDALRKQLLIPRYFAFQTRNNLGGYESYQKLWPIPVGQLSLMMGWKQNPGY